MLDEEDSQRKENHTFQDVEGLDEGDLYERKSKKKGGFK